MASELIVIFDTTTGAYIVKQAGADQIGPSAITSGKIASGIIGAVHIADAALISSKYSSGSIGTTHIAAGSILSALIGANVIATPHVLNQGILSASFGAAAVGTPHIANQAVLSALVGANVLATAHIANAGILSASIASGHIGRGHIAATAVASAQIAAGAVGHGLVTDYGIVSGKVASGAITENQLASGISIDISETVQEPSYRAALAIAAYEAVYFSASGFFSQAQAGVATKMPAVGIAGAAIASGAIGTILGFGRVTNTAWALSGSEGKVVFCGTSSEITKTAPSTSGAIVQRMGTIIGGATIMLMPDVLAVQVGQ